MDFFPTFAQLAGVAPPEALQIDGINILSVLKGDAKEHNRTLHWLFADSWAVRKGSWKLMGHGNTVRSLVNLAEDIGEKQNVLKEQPERVIELKKLHVQWIESVGRK